MALRLRRALSLSFSLLHHSLHQPKPISSISSTSSTYSHLLSTATRTSTVTPTSSSALSQLTRPFTSTTTLFRKAFDPETDEIGPDTILFEGCDYNHWLITIDFPKDSNLTREQMIETYVNTAAQVFGSVEEAKKKIYALSTTTYQGFQVECSEETSEKFKNLPGVVFVLPDSYIDPVNKEYGGDKYVNGEIFPRPPPVHYGRRNNRDNRRPREQNYGPPQSQRNYGPPPPQQNYGPPPPPQQNYGPPPPQQNYGPPPPPPQQNYGPSPLPQQNYGPPPPRQNYGPPPPQQNYGPPPPQQNYGPPPPPRQNYGPPPPQQSYGPPPQRQNYGPPPQEGYVPPPQQSYNNPPNFQPQQNYSPPGAGERRGPPHQGNLNQAEPGNHFAQGQRDFQLQRGFSQDANYGSPQGGGFEQLSGGQGNVSSTGNN